VAEVIPATAVSQTSEAFSLLAAAEGRYATGYNTTADAIEQCTALGLGVASGFGPVELVAAPRINSDDPYGSLVFTSLSYDEDVLYGNLNVDNACRRTHTVLLAGRPGFKESWAAVVALDLPRGIVAMTADASQSLLWVVDRESRFLFAYSLKMLVELAQERIQLGTSIERVSNIPVWASSEWSASSAYSLGSAAFPAVGRGLTLQSSSLYATAFSDLVIALEPNPLLPNSVAIAGYSVDYTTRSVSEAGVEQMFRSVRVTTAGVIETDSGEL